MQQTEKTDINISHITSTVQVVIVFWNENIDRKGRTFVFFAMKKKFERCGHTDNNQSKAIAKSSQIRHQIHQQQELQMEKEFI